MTDWRKSIQMQKYKIEISDLAEQDLEFAADYIAFDLKNSFAAVNTVQGIRKQINKLQNFPERNELDDDPVLAGLGVRMDYYKNYKIYYVVEDKSVIIVRILHMLVDSKAWLYRTLGMKD